MSQPDYKNTVNSWLGEGRNSWGVRRLKTLIAQPITDGPHETPEFLSEGIPFLSVDGIQNGELIFDGCRYISQAAHIEYQRKCTPRFNDILIGKAASTGKIARVKVDTEFSVWSPLALIRPNQSKVQPNFLEYSLKSAVTQAQIDCLCTANTQKNISMQDIPSLMLCIPPISTQQSITAYLDEEMGKIDRLMEMRHRQKALLKEQREALIQQAVTRGLNPNVPMKDSSLPWLGEVPAHWEMFRMKMLAQSLISGPFGSSLTKDMYVSSGFRIYGQEQVIPADFSVGDYFITPEKFKEMGRYAVLPGDVLISCVGSFGKIAVVPDDIHPGIINPRLLRLRPRKQQVIPEYLGEVLRSSVGFTQMEQEGRGGIMDIINIGLLGQLRLPLPPKNEQAEILAFIAQEKTRFANLEAAYTRQLELLMEYRTALIHECVTGQCIVPEAANA